MTFVEIIIVGLMAGFFAGIFKLTVDSWKNPDKGTCPKCKIKLSSGKSQVDKGGTFDTFVCRRCGYVSRKYRSFN